MRDERDEGRDGDDLTPAERAIVERAWVEYQTMRDAVDRARERGAVVVLREWQRGGPPS